MSVREFAAHLGVSDRMVSKWEAPGSHVVPRPVNQQLLAVCLERASERERERFVQLRLNPSGDCALVVRPDGEAAPTQTETLANLVGRLMAREDMRLALARRDIAGVYRILGRNGVPQRRIAAATEQSQSEISEILKGRRVVAYDVLVRIAERLHVPRGFMGLAYCSHGLEGREES
jgi:transcriptional regulator with XRE-family HTH domain